ncbi:hypothetical protein D3C85_1892000 [compost metagenome]
MHQRRHQRLHRLLLVRHPRAVTGCGGVNLRHLAFPRVMLLENQGNTDILLEEIAPSHVSLLPLWNNGVDSG